MPAKKSSPKKKSVSQAETSSSAQKAGAYLMDTNVILVANRNQKEVSEGCIRTCLRWIADLKKGEYNLVLDESGLILEEYKKGKDRQNSVHSQFLIWLF